MDELNELRKKIDSLDSQLLSVLQKRMQVVTEVGKLKKSHGIKPLDSDRWNEVVAKNVAEGEKLGLKREFLEKILDTIHEEALQIEK